MAEKYTKKPVLKQDVVLRNEVVLEVLSGRMTKAEGARRLGLSWRATAVSGRACATGVGPALRRAPFGSVGVGSVKVTSPRGCACILSIDTSCQPSCRCSFQAASPSP